MDGYSSASIIYQYLTKDLGYPEELVIIYVHDGKKHGIPLDEVIKENPDLLIVPDAGSSDYEEHEELHEVGIKTLVLDHHLAPKESRYATVINNQLSTDFPWKALTGSNIVYLFCEAYSDKYNEGKSVEEYLDLCYIGSIADRTDLRDTGSFYFYHKGSQRINNPLVTHIIEKNKSMELGKRVTAKDVGWKIAPFINAIIRNGSHERQKMVVDAIIGKDYEVYNTRLKDHFPVVEEAIRAMTSARNNQSTKTREAMELLEKRIEEMGTAENKVLLVNSTGIIKDSGLNGLVAIKLAEQYQRPTLVLQYNEEEQVLRGSGRNFTGSPVEDFRGLLEESGVFNYARGHSGAFGTEIGLEEAGYVIDVLNDLLADVEYDNLLHEVDISYYQKPDAEEILKIAMHEELWGEGLESPKVHVEDVIVNKSDIRFIGGKGNVWNLDMGTCEGIMFNLTDSQKLALTGHEENELRISIVGECSVNDFRGQKRPQIVIEDFEAIGIPEEDDNPWEDFEVNMLPF